MNYCYERHGKGFSWPLIVQEPFIIQLSVIIQNIEYHHQSLDNESETPFVENDFDYELLVLYKISFLKTLVIYRNIEIYTIIQFLISNRNIPIISEITISLVAKAINLFRHLQKKLKTCDDSFVATSNKKN